ncbi:unnamed protein product, partial [Acidocella sp. C78]
VSRCEINGHPDLPGASLGPGCDCHATAASRGGRQGGLVACGHRPAARRGCTSQPGGSAIRMPGKARILR